MTLVEDVDVIASDTAADILRGVDHAVDLDLGPLRDDTGIRRNSVSFLRQIPGAGHAAPAFGT